MSGFPHAIKAPPSSYLNYCKRWARVLDIIAEDLGYQVLDSEKDIKARVLQFATGLRIHALSSSPDAIVAAPLAISSSTNSPSTKTSAISSPPCQKDCDRIPRDANTGKA